MDDLRVFISKHTLTRFTRIKVKGRTYAIK